MVLPCRMSSTFNIQKLANFLGRESTRKILALGHTTDVIELVHFTNWYQAFFKQKTHWTDIFFKRQNH